MMKELFIDAAELIAKIMGTFRSLIGDKVNSVAFIDTKRRMD